jgi:hypothetical protein
MYTTSLWAANWGNAYIYQKKKGKEFARNPDAQIGQLGLVWNERLGVSDKRAEFLERKGNGSKGA